MARLEPEMVERAKDLIALYPERRSALIPLLHVAQEQDGWITNDAMVHIAELLDLTPAEVLGTCSFYEMFKREPVGRYLVNVCTNISCMLTGGYELLDHLEQRLGVSRGGTTADGVFTLEEVECVAACTQAPCVLVNYRTFGPLTSATADTLVDDLASGRLSETVPPHGTLNRVRRDITAWGGVYAGDPPEPERSPPGGPAPTEPGSKDPTAPTRESEASG